MYTLRGTRQWAVVYLPGAASQSPGGAGSRARHPALGSAGPQAMYFDVDQPGCLGVMLSTFTYFVIQQRYLLSCIAKVHASVLPPCAADTQLPAAHLTNKQQALCSRDTDSGPCRPSALNYHRISRSAGAHQKTARRTALLDAMAQAPHHQRRWLESALALLPQRTKTS